VRRPDPGSRSFDGVDVKLRSLLGTSMDVAEARDVLTPDERARADRFHFDRDRRRFTLARACLRHALAEVTGASARGLRLEYGPFGKPRLPEGPTFNLSHADDWAAIAIDTTGRQRELGIDLEGMRTLPDFERLTETVFSAAERRAISELPADRRIEGFFSGWTRKEAYLKARGDGLQRPLTAFAVSVVPEHPVRLLQVDDDAAETERWQLHAYVPVATYLAALCIEVPPGSSVTTERMSA
jgi:4'-phosphopantetheinyl transferase